jgi:hypothetical protein
VIYLLQVKSGATGESRTQQEGQVDGTVMTPSVTRRSPPGKAMNAVVALAEKDEKRRGGLA